MSVLATLLLYTFAGHGTTAATVRVEHPIYHETRAIQQEINLAQVHEALDAVFRPGAEELDGEISYFLNVDGDSLDVGHPLKEFADENHHFLLYLGVNGIRPSLHGLVADSPTEAEFQRRYADVVRRDPVFDSVVLPAVAHHLQSLGIGIRGYVPAEPRVVSVEEVMEVAVRFFYPDTVSPDGRIQSHICVGINGLEDFPDRRDIAVEAFAYSAIFNDLLAPRHMIEVDFREAERLINELRFSSDPQVRLARAQGVMWSAMLRSRKLRDALAEEVSRTRSYLPLAVVVTLNS